MSSAFEVCYNRCSILTCSKEEALEQFKESLRGLLNVYNRLHKDCTTAAIYYDVDSPHSQCLVALDYSLKDALAEMEYEDPDLYDFFLTLETHAPFTQFVPPEMYDCLHRWGFAAGKAAGPDGKIFYFALLINAYILSMPCDGWNHHFIKCYGHGIPVDSSTGNIVLKNICETLPSFLPPPATKIVKRFDQNNCTLYVYFSDHPPPHVHARHHDWCAVFCLDDEVTLIAGRIPEVVKGKVKKYIRDEFDKIKNAWDELNPIIH